MRTLGDPLPRRATRCALNVTRTARADRSRHASGSGRTRTALDAHKFIVADPG